VILQAIFRVLVRIVVALSDCIADIDATVARRQTANRLWGEILGNVPTNGGEVSVVSILKPEQDRNCSRFAGVIARSRRAGRHLQRRLRSWVEKCCADGQAGRFATSRMI